MFCSCDTLFCTIEKRMRVNRRTFALVLRIGAKRMAYISNQMMIVVASLALAFVVVVAGLVIAVFYYRWRLHDSHCTLYRIIRENLDLHAKLEQPDSASLNQTNKNVQ